MKYYLFTITLFLTSFLQAQPSFQSFETNTGNSGADAIVNTPSGTSANDLLIVGLMYEKGNAETITPATGWTLIRKTDNSDECGLATYYKVASDSEPSSYTFSFAEGSKWAVGISRIDGVDTSSPIEISGEATGKSTTISASSITTSSGNCLVLCYYTNKVDETFTQAGGTTERYDAPNTINGSISNMMASFVQGTSGATGTKDVTATDDYWASQQIALVFETSMPIELSAFQAEVCEDSLVCLFWQTAQETNNQYFTVEKSQDGLRWTDLHIIDGAGNSVSTQNYEYIDIHPRKGISYYRLKQTDYNGQSTHSDVESVMVSISHLRLFRLFPNPSSEKITLEGKLSELEDWMIYDMFGTDMNGSVQILKLSNTRYVLDVSKLQQGMYILSTTDSITAARLNYKFKILR